MFRISVAFASLAGFAVLAAGVASAQQDKAARPDSAERWVPPGTPGSPIDGTIFHAQVLLDRASFPPGVIDGKKGMSFEQALRGFQKARGLEQTGELDNATRVALLRNGIPSTVRLRVAEGDVDGPFVGRIPDDPAKQAEMERLGYRNALEKLAEKFHTTPRTIVALNPPGTKLAAGSVLRLPNVLPSSRSYEGLSAEHAPLFSSLNVSAGQPQGNRVVVDKSEGMVQVYRGEQLIAQFPATMGSTRDPLPLGTWKITTFAYLPPFHYQPDLFWDVADSKEEQRLPPGPNGPVGVAWLDLTKEHYGIHGTGEPQTIGRAESHGCIRLTNWDVLRLSLMVDPGVTAVLQA